MLSHWGDQCDPKEKLEGEEKTEGRGRKRDCRNKHLYFKVGERERRKEKEEREYREEDRHKKTVLEFQGTF